MMEEPRLPPTATTTTSTSEIVPHDKPDEPNSTLHRSTTSLPSTGLHNFSLIHILRNHSLNHSTDIPSSSSHRLQNPILDLDTYVVHVPRDQVYWTPPPEHAKIVEQRRNAPEKNNKNYCSKGLIIFVVSLVILVFIICLMTLIIHFIFKPIPPIFAILNLALNSPKSRDFEVVLSSKNPTSNMWVTYRGFVSLTYKNKILGQGNFPELSMAASESETVDFTVEKSKSVVMSSSEFKEALNLVLKMEIKGGFGSGLVKRNKEAIVTCDVKVKGLLDAKRVQIVSEKCESEFKN